MEPISWSQFGNIHPYAPEEQLEGYRQLVDELELMLAEITGYDAVSLQPNAGSQENLQAFSPYGRTTEAAGILNGTCALSRRAPMAQMRASAVMAGMDVVVVACDQRGDVDLVHLDELISTIASELPPS